MRFLLGIGLAIIVTALTAVGRPNIVLIVADDLRADVVQDSAALSANTPHLKALATAGVNFTAARIQGSDQGAVCVASRAMLWSGQSLWRKNDQLSGRNTLGEILRKNGYRSLGTGKWHNGDESLVRTFSQAVNITPGFLEKGHTSPFTIRNVEDGKLFRGKNKAGLHSSDLIGATAVELISRQTEETPFFLYVGFNAPHDPFDAPLSFLPGDGADLRMRLPANFLAQPLFDHGAEINGIRDEKLLPKPLDRGAVTLQNIRYLAMISHVDHWLGKILGELEARGFDDNTLVIFTSDHGLARGSHGLLGKQNLYEHSLKVPLIVKGPGTDPRRRSGFPLYQSEIFPTLLDYARCPDPAGKSEGVSFRKIIEGAVDPPARTTYHAYGNWMRAVIDGPIKLIEYHNSTGRYTRLYDLQADPLEMRDLAGEPARSGELARLREVMRKEKEQFADLDPIFWN